MDISNLIEAIEARKVLISDHADEEAQEDELEFNEIYASVKTGEIIEDYPDDRPCPSCLVLGMTTSGTPIHSVWGYDQSKQIAILITVYRPDSVRWENWRIRRTTNGTT